ncbi:MAG: NAD-dependent epimerase/dehydratase family protein [Verrucomicrobia bacterium]|nr:NAD-dependent epimerase/dehydratase family protein [Verrucomicrobiota bacterium]
MKYFITGITGFAGPHLAQLLLREGHAVHALVRESNGREMDLLDLLDVRELEAISFHYGDLLEYHSLARIFGAEQYDGVFHLAAQSHPPTSFTDPVGTFASNVQGTVNLIDVAQRCQKNCSLMFCSTSEVYGDTGKTIGVLQESLPLRPSNPYAASKAAIDLYMQERCRNGFIRGFTTRAFSHTGPRRGKKFSISWDAYNLALMATGKTTDRVLPVGNLETQRIVIDVRDCVRAYYLLMQNYDNGEAYNVCGDIASVCKMQVFTDKLIEISGLAGVEKRVSDKLYRPIDIQIQVGDTTKICAKTGWKPAIPIEQTLADLYQYWVRKLTT